MTPEERQMLAESLRLSQENNRLLHKIRRSAVIGNLMNFVYYFAIIGLPIILYYYFLQPYVNQFFGYYQQVQNAGNNAPAISTQLQNPNLQKILQNLGITIPSSQ